MGRSKIGSEALPRPFLKWAGGKRQLLPELLARVPEPLGTFHEPFVGGGALFFELSRLKRLGRASLSDQNPRLVATWRAVRDHVDPLIERLRQMPYEQDFYYAQRARDIDGEGELEIGAWFIYLNKTAFNGLYRVNSKGRHNVPFGRYSNPTICDEPALRAASAALQGVDIQREDFAAVAERAVAGDFVYFDPPYVPLTASSNFTAYTADGFTSNDQVRLRDLALQLKGRGVRVLLSNSSSPAVEALYAEGFEVWRVPANRGINSKADARGAVDELIIA